MDFEWDDEKDAWLRAHRGFGFADVVPIFRRRTVEWQDPRDYGGEIRRLAVGETDSVFFTVVYTDREAVRRLITAWRSNRKERARWPV